MTKKFPLPMLWAEEEHHTHVTQCTPWNEQNMGFIKVTENIW